jgi:hypothetical protein
VVNIPKFAVYNKDNEDKIDELAALIYRKWIKAIEKYNSSYQLTA